MMKELETECNNITADEQSKFKLSKDEFQNLRNPSFLDGLYDTMCAKCPRTYQFIQAAAYNWPQLAMNKTKTVSAVKGATLQVFSTMLNIRNRKVNAVQAVNSIILRRGGADKQTFRRLNSLSFTVNYAQSLKIQESLGKEFDVPVKAWMKERPKEVVSFSLIIKYL